MRALVVTALAAAVVLAACKGDSTAPVKLAGISVSIRDTIRGTTRVITVTDTIKATVSAAVNPSPTFVVLDEKGNAVANVPVTVTVGVGGGQVAGSPSVSGSIPVSVGTWVLGSTKAVNTLIVAAAGLPPATITAVARPPYFVDLRFVGPPIDPSLKAPFEAAKARVESIITGDLADATVTALDVSACNVTGVPPLTETIDDIVVFAVVDSIDGPGKVLGNSGPCYVRNTGGLSLIAGMHFDIADFQNLKNDGRVNDVVLHEMLHAVGFGTLWASKGQISGATTPSSAFVGLQAVAGCVFHGGTAVNQCGGGTVPLETTGGEGTRDRHWREATTATGIGFRAELMTGFISAPGVPNPLSRISIGSLADIGYTVNVAAADAYTVPATAADIAAQLRAAPAGSGAFQINETVREPIASVDAKGRVTPILRRRQ